MQPSVRTDWNRREKERQERRRGLVTNRTIRQRRAEYDGRAEEVVPVSQSTMLVRRPAKQRIVRANCTCTPGRVHHEGLATRTTSVRLTALSSQEPHGTNVEQLTLTLTIIHTALSYCTRTRLNVSLVIRITWPVDDDNFSNQHSLTERFSAVLFARAPSQLIWQQWTVLAVFPRLGQTHRPPHCQRRSCFVSHIENSKNNKGYITKQHVDILTRCSK